MKAGWQRRIAACWKAIAPLPPADPTHCATAQHLMLSLLCLQLCEQRGLLAVGQLPALMRQSDPQQRLCQLLQTVQARSLPIPDVWLSSVSAVSDAVLRTSLARLCPADAEPIGVTVLGQAYEQSLAPPFRKAGGTYYTPEAIAAFMVEQTVGAHVQAALPRVLDPACGGGMFLLSAYERLLAGAGSPQPPSLQQRQQLLRQLYGVDIDPQAIAITKISLLLKLLEDLPVPPPQLPDLASNIQCGNAIVGSAFDWQQAFPDVMQAGGFDVVIGNPPYVDAEQMSLHLLDWRQYCAQHYRTAAGNWDLFCIFIEKAIDLCRPGGLISQIVPNKLASAAYARQARSLLTQANQLLSIRDYSLAQAFSVAVYPLVYVACKRLPNRSALVRYEAVAQCDQQWNVTTTRMLNFEHFSHPAGWLLSIAPSERRLLDRLQREFPPLATHAQVTGAATVAEAYALQPLIHSAPSPERGDLRMVNSGTIDRYRLRWGEKPMRYLGTTYQYPVVSQALLHQLSLNRRQQSQQPKLIMSGMAQQLKCAIDATGGVLAGKSTVVIRSAIDLRYLLGLLNSRLLSFYFVHSFGGNRLQRGYLRIGPPQIRQIPLCLEVSDRLIALVEQRLSAAAPSEIDRQIDALVYGLYGLSDAEIAAVNACHSTDVLL